MSILGGRENSNKMSQPYLQLHEFKKQASFFLKEKIKTARLALTDVTPAQLLAEEATNGNPGAPDTRTLKMISKAAFEVDDYWRIVGILHKKLSSFDRKNWRVSYKAVIVLEHLLTHGPESVAEEFLTDKDVIKEMGHFQLIDEKGFNWGLNVRNKSERILKLLENGQLLKDERNKARKISRGIEGFGSFNIRTNSAEGILEESAVKPYGRSNSQFNDHGNEDDENSNFNTKDFVSTKMEKVEDAAVSSVSFKENMAPSEDMHKWNFKGESKSLLDEQKTDPRIGFSSEEDHPFTETDRLTSASLLSSGDQVLQTCQ
ncbi:PREDICTED: epsin-3 isoform X1 [Nicotiana attenuata]|uniref:Clathrin interactor epsin 2 n=1 Tax=Nicotiana attenuata TaxID=49451 RepID=A0A314L6L8_NICAT|nr:PREDICTED: epsin-3 isoform X1 [Nicotiana attenuata]OIT37205.1 clathrin interactor epsin 2 [Nicotiana attenuata]